MKLVLLTLLCSSVCLAGNVKGYTKKNGTYVQPYVTKTKPAVIKK